MQRHERSFGGFWLSPNATNPLGRRFVASEARVAREERAKHKAANRFSTAIQQYSLTPTASTNRKNTKTTKSTRLTIRRTRRIQSKKSLVEKGRFRLAESDCVRDGLRVALTKNPHRTRAVHVVMGIPLLFVSPPRRGESEPSPGGRFLTLNSSCGQEHSFHCHQVHRICPQAVRCWMLGLRSRATPLTTVRRGTL